MAVLKFLIALQIATASPDSAAIRINQLGYLPDAPKVAVFCSLAPTELGDFVVTDIVGKKILQRPAVLAKPFGPCIANYRLDFSSVKRPGDYRITAVGITMSVVRIRQNAYAGASDN